MSTLASIGLGSNLGDRKAALDFAVAALSNTPGVTVRAVSSYHETPPVGGPSGQGTFLNAAAVVETTRTPGELLDALHRVEAELGRVRLVRWGERTLDLDMLLYGDAVHLTPRLTVPHPRMALRRFVLAPLVEVAHAAVDPLTGRTVVDLLANLDRRPSYVALHGDDLVLKRAVLDRLLTEGPSPEWAVEAPEVVDVLTFEDPDPLVRLAGQVIGRARGTASRAWSPSSDCWLVSDYCLPLDLVTWMRLSTTTALRSGGKLSLRRNQRRAFDPAAVGRAAETEGALMPTFGVVLGEEPDSRFQPAGWPLPLLFPGSADPDTIVSEVRAACAATRAG